MHHPNALGISWRPPMIVALLASCAMLSACAGDPSIAEPVDVAVDWSLTGAETLPEDVESLELETCVTEDGVETCDSFSCSINALTLSGGVEAANCRPAAGTEEFEDSPVLVRQGLPTRTPLRFELRGLNASDVMIYVGHAGPFVLGEGERRNLSVRMYRAGGPTTIPGATVARLLHTGTLLPDGRVLIAGGFDRATALAMCPPELTLVSETKCFALTATASALAFDITSGEVAPVRSPMLTARGGHTATELPDGRVLLAGGSSSAILAMIPQGVAAANGYRMEIFPTDTSGMPTAHATYELFDAFLDIEEDDVDRDGDPGAGRFIGIAGTGSLGALNQARFLHGAAAVPQRPERVLLVGGSGGASSEDTFEVFDAEKAGGFGVHQAAGNQLLHPHPMPGLAGVDGDLWIFGGGPAADNDALAEIWSFSATDPNGSVALATEGEFPNSVVGLALDEERPGYALLRPSAISIDNGQRPLVVGWYGPRCDVGAATPVFGDGAGTELCNAPDDAVPRSFTINSATGLTIPTPSRPHAFGALAVMRDFQGVGANTRFAVSGGIVSSVFGGSATVDVYSGTVDSTGAAARLAGVDGVVLQRRRFFHTSTGMPGHGMITVGGMNFTPSVDQVLLEGEVEAVYLPR